MTTAEVAARITALTVHDRTLLVEAGAGSGKTALMAGRVTMMLLGGIEPRHIVAITFTEAAAGELLSRIRDYVKQLISGAVPRPLEIALPAGPDETQRTSLKAAASGIDELTCCTIHSFCQRLIRPYPVDADTDPGAGIMTPVEVELQLNEAIDSWLREQLEEVREGYLPELIWAEPNQTLALVRTIVKHYHESRHVQPPDAAEVAAEISAFHQSARSFIEQVRQSTVQVDDVLTIAKELEELAQLTERGPVGPDPAHLVRVLGLELSDRLVTAEGRFRAFRHKTKYMNQAKLIGESRAVAEDENDRATTLYKACADNWNAAKAAAASVVLNGIMHEVKPILDKFTRSKRNTAQLDFDDLLYTARDLLRDHEPVRQALADRYRHVLVDEFQDTDPLQAEILWRLCGTSAVGANDDWLDRIVRPGALFLVGDPKQAIYSFRGADVKTYVRARESLVTQDPGCRLEITTNFRSQASILEFANSVFHELLDSEGQPGFTPLTAAVADKPGLPQVSCIEIAVPYAENTAANVRAAESVAIAELCAQLIGDHMVSDPETGEMRPCRPGDIALLAPAGTGLYLYENELENLDIPIASQAGKGMYQRQEVQDLIALTRLLADSRDTVALGAFLRGPMVGLTEEQLLDIIDDLSPAPDHPELHPRLHLHIDTERISNSLARDTIAKLQSLYRQSNSTTPYDLLSRAVELLRIRPLLSSRHRRRAERALANLDTYLEMLHAYSVRGLRAAAEAMTEAWRDNARAIEGRTDAPDDAVSIVTMHSAKGLEWPIVIPINCMSSPRALSSDFVDRDTNVLYCPVLRTRPHGYKEAAGRYIAEQDLERVRLWYVALTRARDALILTKWALNSTSKTWADYIELNRHTGGMEAPPIGNFPTTFNLERDQHANGQTRELFAVQAKAIVTGSRHLKWFSPSRDEDLGPVLTVADAAFDLVDNEPDDTKADVLLSQPQGGRERGLVLHKLMEEVLTGEVGDTSAELLERATTLVAELGHEAVEDASLGLSPTELSDCVTRTLALPQVAALRRSLMPEFPVGYSVTDQSGEQVTVGVSDAVAYNADGWPTVVVDWKSDVNPQQATIDHYRSQVGVYMQAVGAQRGLIVFMTTGRCIEITA